MSTSKHLIEREELMAYLDGELSPDRAIAAAEHLKKCRECQSIAGDLQSVSRRMMTWQVKPPEDLRIAKNIRAALDEPSQKSDASQLNRRGWREVLGIPRLPRWVWGTAAAVIGLIVLSSLFFTQSYAPMQVAHRLEEPKIGEDTAALSKTERGARDVTRNGTSGRFEAEGQAADQENGSPKVPNGPMIVRTAALTLTTKEFEKARAGLEQILKQHGGYVGQLNVSAPSGSGRTLNATLRVPSDQLDATLAELKKLGRVDAETQSGEEVTQQYVDLVARLANARNSEQRLTEILRQRTGKLSDVLAVEVEIDRVRGEIERMEAERKNLAHQVDFATLTATLTEEYENQLQAVPVSTWTRMRNSAIEGYTALTESIIGLILFLLSYGPNILVWGGLLLLILYFVWKRLRKHMALN